MLFISFRYNVGPGVRCDLWSSCLLRKEIAGMQYMANMAMLIWLCNFVWHTFLQILPAPIPPRSSRRRSSCRMCRGRRNSCAEIVCTFVQGHHGTLCIRIVILTHLCGLAVRVRWGYVWVWAVRHAVSTAATATIWWCVWHAAGASSPWAASKRVVGTYSHLVICNETLGHCSLIAQTNSLPHAGRIVLAQ